MEPLTGTDPALSPWEGDVLPLHHGGLCLLQHIRLPPLPFRYVVPSSRSRRQLRKYLWRNRSIGIEKRWHTCTTFPHFFTVLPSIPKDNRSRFHKTLRSLPKFLRWAFCPLVRIEKCTGTECPSVRQSPFWKPSFPVQFSQCCTVPSPFAV